MIFDEAELAAQREGWDAARWSRHLAAKLHRHQQVLPPGMESESPEAASEPLVIYQRPESDGDMSAFLTEMDALSFDIPQDGLLKPRPEAFNPYDPTLAEIEPIVEQDGLSSLDFELPAMDFQPAPSIDVEPAAALNLEPEMTIDSPAGTEARSNERFRLDLDALNLRIADMQLEDSRPVLRRATMAPSWCWPALAVRMPCGNCWRTCRRFLPGGVDPAAARRRPPRQTRPADAARHGNAGALWRKRAGCWNAATSTCCRPKWDWRRAGRTVLQSRCRRSDGILPARTARSCCSAAAIRARSTSPWRTLFAARYCRPVARRLLRRRGGGSTGGTRRYLRHADDIAKQLAARWPS